MKKFFMFAALAVAVGFTSCQKEGGNTNVEGDPVSIRIKLDNDVVTGTRAFDDIDSETGLKQNKVSLVSTDKAHVYIFNKQGKRLHYDGNTTVALLKDPGATYTWASNNMITTAASKIVVLGNVPTTMNTAMAAVGVYEDLQRLTQSLDAAQTFYATGNNGVITVYGEGTITWNENLEEIDGVMTAIGASTVNLNPLLARIDVTVTTSGITKGLLTEVPTGGNPGVILKGVATLYSGTATHFAKPFVYTYADATAASGKALVSGLIPTIPGTPDDDVVYPLWEAVEHGDAAQLTGTFLNGAWEAPYLASGTFTKSFYAFPPTAVANSKGYSAHTIVTVYGDYYDKNGDVTPLFWPAHFTTEDLGKVLEEGQRYLLTLTLTGDFSDGDGGNTDPEDKRPANVTVKITDAQWKSKIVLEKTFN